MNINPFFHLSKAETVKLGIANGIDYALKISCYSVDQQPGATCEKCANCTYRKKGFGQAGIKDPTTYLL